jgi:ribokinase
MKPAIAVIGSIVIDFPLVLPRPAVSGETLKVQSPGLNLGGKAVNQGLQALLCGVPPALIGKVGRDIFGEWARTELTRYHFDLHGISASRASTSWAVPIIEPNNQYILHVAGANAEVTAGDIAPSHPLWDQPRVLLVQGEIPAAASVRAGDLMHGQHGLVICDPAPAGSMTPELLHTADILTPNAQELAMLTHQDTADFYRQLAQVWEEYPQLSMLIVTLGAEGVWLQEQGQKGRYIAPPAVHATDPTAAGDAFNGTFAAALIHGSNPLQACEMGCCAGALAATTLGAAQSLVPQERLLELWRETYPH